MLPKIKNYGQYSSDNYGINSLKVTTEHIELWYSYETIIAYRDFQDGLVVSKNDWGLTTGKHLNWINSDKERRLPYDKFYPKLQAALARHIVQGERND